MMPSLPVSHTCSLPIPTTNRVIVLGAIVGGFALSRTVLFTSTRPEAPTFWQRNRTAIALHLVAGLVFYLLGFLAPHS